MGGLPSLFSNLEHQSLCCSFYFNHIFGKECKELMEKDRSKKEASSESNAASGEETVKSFLFCELNIGTDFTKHEDCVEK